MSLSFHTIKPAKGSKKKRKRIGRGGKRGTYSGRGLKGQKARSGVSGLKRLGMKPLMEQTPKLRGFKSHKPKPEILNLDILNKKFSDGDKITPDILLEKKILKNIKNGVKILGNGDITIKLEIANCELSKSAREKIESAGGVIL